MQLHRGLDPYENATALPPASRTGTENASSMQGGRARLLLTSLGKHLEALRGIFDGKGAPQGREMGLLHSWIARAEKRG